MQIRFLIFSLFTVLGCNQNSTEDVLIYSDETKVNLRNQDLSLSLVKLNSDSILNFISFPKISSQLNCMVDSFLVQNSDSISFCSPPYTWGRTSPNNYLYSASLNDGEYKNYVVLIKNKLTQDFKNELEYMVLTKKIVDNDPYDKVSSSNYYIQANSGDTLGISTIATELGGKFYATVSIYKKSNEAVFDCSMRVSTEFLTEEMMTEFWQFTSSLRINEAPLFKLNELKSGQVFEVQFGGNGSKE